MTKDSGRSPSGSGHSAEPEPSSTVSAVPASVHNAKKKKQKSHPEQFFIVFSPSGEAPPKIVHDTHPAAFFAAAQMARFHPDASFFVMGSMSARVRPREEPTSAIEAAAAGETGNTDSTEGESATSEAGDAR